MFFSKNKKKISESPKELIKRLGILEEEVKNITQKLEDIGEKSRGDLRKIGMIRFNPFKEIGGDQSFCIAGLNENSDGFVITSHYGREANRVYAKPVKQGKSKYQLSNEEGKAIEEAIISIL